MSDCIDHGFAGSGLGYSNTWSKCDKRMRGRHVLALIDSGVEVPDGAVVMHSCDNPRCVNAEHLSVGTHSENMMDCSRKGRLVTFVAPGEANAQARLTEDQVREIRWQYSFHKKLTQTTLAKEYGVKQPLISKIVLHQSWAHI